MNANAGVPVLDYDSLLERIGGDRQRLIQLYEFSVNEIMSWSDKLKKAREAGGSEDLRKCVHGMKGASSTIGAERCRRIFLQMEESIAEINTEKYDSIFAQCLLEIDSLISELNRKIS